MHKAIKSVGWLLAFDAGITGSVSIVGRLLIGVLGGLPAAAIAISSMVAFTLSALLELPAGILTDLFGRARAVKLGYLFQALASFFLFLAFMVYPENPTAMWVFLIAEAVFDAFGIAFVSGSAQAIYQEVIKKSGRDLPPEELRRLEETGQMQAEAYGRFFAFCFPLLGLGATLILYKYGNPALFLLTHVMAWLVVVFMVHKLVRDFELSETTSADVKAQLKEWRDGLAIVKRKDDEARDARYALTTGVLGICVYGSVEAYLVVMLLRFEAGGTWEVWVPAMLLTLAVVTGHLLRSYVLPWAARLYSNRVLIAAASGLLIALSGAAITMSENWTGQTVFFGYMAYILIFHILVAIIIRASQGILLRATPDHTHATIVSIRGATALLVLGLYSLSLSRQGGVPALRDLFALHVVICIILLVWTLLRRERALR